MALAKDSGSPWSAALEEKCTREADRLRVRLTNILRESLASLLNSGTEADFTVSFVDDSVPLHSCLIRARLPELWNVLLNDQQSHLVGKAINKEDFMQILRYIYTEDDVEPAHLHVAELHAAIHRLKQSDPTAQLTPGDKSTDRSRYDALSSGTSHEKSPKVVQSRIVDSHSSQVETKLSQNHSKQDSNGFQDQVQDQNGKEGCQRHSNCSNEESELNSASEIEARKLDTAQLTGSSEANTAQLTGSSEPITAQLTGSSEPNTAQLTGSSEPNTAQLTGSSEPNTAQLTGSVEIYCQLGQDLLHMYQTALGSNVKVKVKDTKLQLHRCILCVRSRYFGAMLGGQWKESEAREINLEGINPLAMQQAFVYLYGGIPDIQLTSSYIVELLTIADMYGLDGLSDIICFSMKKACHFFHKPCNECVPWMLNVLPMADMFCLEEIRDKGLRWCSRHVSRVWGAKQFANMPQDVLNKILQMTTADITNDSVIDMVLECDQLGGSLTSVRRSEPVIAMAAQLMDSCVAHLKNNFVAVTQTVKFLSLGMHMALGLDFLDDVFCRTLITMPTNKACSTYVRVCELHSQTQDEECPWSEAFKQLIGHLEDKCEHFMRLYINQLINTDDWTNLLGKDLQERIKEGAWYVCVGDGRRLRGPPRCVSYHDPANPPTNDARASGCRPPLPPRGDTRTESKKATKRDIRPKAPRHRKGSSLPRPKREKSDAEREAKASCCTFKAMKMVGDVLTSPSDVQRIKPVVRKSSSEDPSDMDLSVSSQSFSHVSPSQAFLSVGLVSSSLSMTPLELNGYNTDQGTEYSDVFCSPEREYVLVPPTIVKSLEVEAITFAQEELIRWLRWKFYLPK